MIQTAVTLGALPALDEEMSWLPVDHAARVILDLCDITNTGDVIRTPPPHLVYHVLNSMRFHWTRDMLPALSAVGFGFETLPTAQWMDKLRSSERDPKKNPPIKLLDWFESKYGYGASTKGEGLLLYQTEQTSKKSKSMRNIPSVTDVGYLGKVIRRLQEEWNA
jgi:thioester reductase-like protein